MPTHPADRYLSTPIATMNVLSEGPTFDLLIKKLETAIESAISRALQANDDRTRQTLPPPARAPLPLRPAVVHAEAKGKLLKTTEAAEFLGVSQRHLWRLHSGGEMPAPVRIGRAVRWVVADLENWIAAGCPGRESWDNRKRS
jgi:prophage regulatory protein